MNNSVSTMTGKTKIKIVFLGNQSVGKSSIIQKYVNDKFDESSHPTIGIDFLAKNIVHKTKSYRLQLWDTAGQERFKSLIPGYLRDAHCALIIFDVTSKTSLNHAEEWLQLYNENKTTLGFTLLVGNKIDLTEEREVTYEEGKSKAEQLGVIYYEVSAKTGQNLEDLFANVVEISVQKSVQGANFAIKPATKQQTDNIAQEDENEKGEEGKVPQKNEQQNAEPKKEDKAGIVLNAGTNKQKQKQKKRCC